MYFTFTILDFTLLEGKIVYRNLKVSITCFIYETFYRCPSWNHLMDLVLIKGALYNFFVFKVII